MKIINTIEELQNIRRTLNKSIGFVPTMGALHEGHISLIKQARTNNEIVIVSIFVNPAQFLVGEDLESYPKKDAADKKICELCKVDYLFMPQIGSIYQGDDEITIKAPLLASYILEGKSRPGHFDGVLRVVLKLFNLIQPTNAYFGKKDAQQLALISQMVKDLFLPINIIECEIVREADGLAMSSRNIYLSTKQREESLKISKSLKTAGKLIGTGETNTATIKASMKDVIKGLEIEYLAIVDRSFHEIDEVVIGDTVILVVARFANIRLLDNLWL